MTLVKIVRNARIRTSSASLSNSEPTRAIYLTCVCAALLMYCRNWLHLHWCGKCPKYPKYRVWVFSCEGVAHLYWLTLRAHLQGWSIIRIHVYPNSPSIHESNILGHR